MARLPWDQREQLLLEAIRDLEDDIPDLQNGAIAELAGLTEEDTGRGLQALLDGRLILGGDASDMSTPPGSAELHGIRLAPAGRVHVKQWPGAEASEALLEVLDGALERTKDPEQRSALQQARGGLLGLPGKVLTEVAVAYAKRVSGLEG